MNFRLTFYGDRGTIYSYVDTNYKDNEIEIGEWEAPFPNTPEESTAFGLYESLVQSEYCPREFYDGEKVIKVKVELFMPQLFKDV